MLPSDWPLLLMAALLVVCGIVAISAAASIVMLPHEVQVAGFDRALLSGIHPNQTIVPFIVHNRVSFGGLLIVTGLLYWWLVRVPLAAGQPWAWWTLCLSASVGAATYLAYASHAYWDPLHALGTGVIVGSLSVGLLGTRVELMSWKRMAVVPTLIRRTSLSRLLLTVWAVGTLTGGLVILGVGMLPIFVATDLAFLHTTSADLAGFHGSLLPYIAHDRIGLGGALVASGLAMIPIIWCPLQAERSDSLRLLGLVWIIGAITAIGIHPLVGYNSLAHLTPFLIKDGAFLLAIVAYVLNQ